MLAAAEPVLSPEQRELRDLSFPFDGIYRVDPEPAKGDEFFQEHYYGEAGHGPPRRRWPGGGSTADWLGSADNLALQLDSDTNNTSLALAIELSPGGKVLLFPGDAQVGNWLSWHSLRKRPVDRRIRHAPRTSCAAPPSTRSATTRSHNATLREKGLELMARPDLVAMIPVDEQMAHRPKGGNPDGWDMPFGALLERLKEKTRGRVLRADTGLPEKPDGVADAEWDRFRAACAVDDLYVEITVGE